MIVFKGCFNYDFKNTAVRPVFTLHVCTYTDRLQKQNITKEKINKRKKALNVKIKESLLHQI